MPPTTSTGAPAGSRAASSRAAAWAEVTTSAASPGTPSRFSCAAIADGVRDALLVTNASRIPRRLASVRACAAPGTAAPPRYTTPSRSSSATSWTSVSGFSLDRGSAVPPAGRPLAASGIGAGAFGMLGVLVMGPGSSPQRGADAAQRIGVMAPVRRHRGGQREVLGRGAWVPGPGQGQAEAELRVVVARAGLHDPAEVARGGRVLAGVELGPGQPLEDAAGLRLGRGGPLEQLRRRRRAAPAEQFHAPTVQVVDVVTWPGDRLLLGTGILAASWCF